MIDSLILAGTEKFLSTKLEECTTIASINLLRSSVEAEFLRLGEAVDWSHTGPVRDKHNLERDRIRDATIPGWRD